MYRILSLDGGGIRGVFTATFLTRLEEKLDGKKIGECFDFIAGTSTGGILACILLLPGDDGKPKYSAREALDFYLNNGQKIFEITWCQWLSSGGGMLDEKYSTKNLRELIDQYAKDVHLRDLLLPCLITSYDTEARELYLYKSHKAKEDPARDCPIFEVALATSAAPTYFEPIQTAERCLIDGGIFANNPSVCAYFEAHKLKPSESKICMLSIGTGREERPYHYDDLKDYGKFEWIEPVIQILGGASADVMEYFTAKLFEMYKSKEKYYRVNIQLAPGEASMDNASDENITRLWQLANEEFDRLEAEGVIDNILQDLM